MKKNCLFAIAALVVVVISTIVGVLFIVNTENDGTSPDTTSVTTLKTAEKQPAETTGTDRNQCQARKIRKTKNGKNVIRTSRGGRSGLSVPQPRLGRRRDFASQKFREKMVKTRIERRAREGKKKRHGSVPVEVTVQKAQKLRNQGKNDKAIKVMRNAILIERNPMKRQQLVDEFDSWNKGDQNSSTGVPASIR